MDLYTIFAAKELLLRKEVVRDDSVKTVFDSELKGEAEDESRKVTWNLDEIALWPSNLLCSAEKTAIRVQLIQAAHFIFHRINSKDIFPLVSRVILK